MRLVGLITTKFYLLHYILLGGLLGVVFFAEVPAQAFEPSKTSLFLRRECQQYLDSQCRQMPEGVRRSLEACEINKKAHNCDKLAAENPEINDLIISCNPREFCQQFTADGTDEAISCWHGVKGSVSDTATALASLATSAWEKIKNTRASEWRVPKWRRPDLPSWDESRQKISDLWDLSEDLTQKKYHQYACYTPEAKEELKCYVFASIVDPTLVVGKGAKLARAQRLAGGSTKTLTKNLSKEQFNRKYLQYSPTTKEQNLRWMSLAEKAPPPTVFFDVENSVMKKLNDTMKDKNLVTSLTNYHKDILQNRTQKLYLELKKDYPDLELVAYSDFKASRFAFKGRAPPDLEARLNQVLQETNQEFSDYVTKNNYVKNSDHPETWFRAGYGKTADQATLASRFSRQSQENTLHSFSSETIKTTLSQKVKSVETLRGELQNELGRTSLLEGGTKKPYRRMPLTYFAKMATT